MKAVACAVERLWPRRPFRHGVWGRWIGNGGLMLTNLAVVRLVFVPGVTLAVAWYCAENGIGLLNAVDAPAWVAVPAALVGIDLVMWVQHWSMHRSNLLWRAHQVHHSDLDLDFSTGLRFHPLEAMFTLMVRAAAVTALGAPVLAVAIYEVGPEVIDTFVHADVRIPERVDAVLRRILVTPDYHRVHHSAAPEMNRNYAFVLPVWDRLLRTYQDQPEKGHLDMELGLPDRRDARALHFGSLLLLPFRSTTRRAGPS